MLAAAGEQAATISCLLVVVTRLGTRLGTSTRDEAEETFYPDRRLSILIPWTYLPLSFVSWPNIEYALRDSVPYLSLANKVLAGCLVMNVTFLLRRLSDNAQDFLSDANARFCSNMQTFDSKVGPC